MSIADNFKGKDFKASRTQNSPAMKKLMGVGSFKKVLNKKSKRDAFYGVLKEHALGRSGRKQMNKAMKETFRELLDNKNDSLTDKQVHVLAKEVYGNLSSASRFASFKKEKKLADKEIQPKKAEQIQSGYQISLEKGRSEAFPAKNQKPPFNGNPSRLPSVPKAMILQDKSIGSRLDSINSQANKPSLEGETDLKNNFDSRKNSNRSKITPAVAAIFRRTT